MNLLLAKRLDGFTLTLLVLLIVFLNTAKAVSSPVYPLKVSANNRYFIDQNSVPFLLMADSAHALIVNISPNDAVTYFSTRQSQGFNAAWIQLLCVEYTGGRADGSTYDGIAPFTTAWDFSTPNPAYWSRVDTMVNIAAQYGIVCFLDLADTGGLLTQISSNGTTKSFQYGVFLGNRYKNSPNIVWISGNDYNENAPGNGPADACVQAIVKGIRSVDTMHLQTIEMSPPNWKITGGSSLDSGITWNNSAWSALINITLVYSYPPQYAAELIAHGETPTMPSFLGEAQYENSDWSQNGLSNGTLGNLRRTEYWTATCGTTGQFYGCDPVWYFGSQWQSHLADPGAIGFGKLGSLLSTLQWWNLVPDQNHLLVTSGYGSYSLTSTLIEDATYLTAAITPDGSAALVYMPTSRTITVNMANFSGPVSVRWFDPSNGIYISIIGSPFANSGLQEFSPTGNNSAGDTDWALVFAASTPTPSLKGIVKDFNGDGVADLVWNNTSTGQHTIWFLKNGVFSSFISLPTEPVQWNIAGVGDFNGDGNADLVWENTSTGQRAIWFLKNGVFSSFIFLPTEPVQWKIAGAGDFNGDGNADLVWENTSTGQRAIWFLKNGVLSSTINLPTVGLQWRIAGVGDFNGDGNQDLVWENTSTGQRAIWFLKNGVLSSTINLPTVGLQWRIAGAGDFDGDGNADLVWENTSTGQHTIEFLKNGVFSSFIFLPTEPVQWNIADH